MGNHRSGTSALTGCLSHCGGFNLGKTPMKTNKFNSKGYFESKQIINCNKTILKKMGSTWYDHQKITKEQDKIMMNYVERLKGVIQEEYQDHPQRIIIKDPRSVLLYPVYFRALRELGYQTRVIYIDRKSEEIANSLVRAHPRLKPKNCLKMYKKYKSRGDLMLSKINPQRTGMLVHFDQLMTTPIGLMKQINRQLKGLNLKIDRDWLTDFIDPTLRNFKK